MTLLIGLTVCTTILLSSCWHDAPKLPKIKETRYCFAPSNDYSRWISSNGFHSFYYPADSTFNLSTKLKAADYSENFIFYPSGELYIFLSTDTKYGLWGSYYVDGDTIKAQFYPAPINVAGFREEVWLKLIDPHKLIILGRAWNKPLDKADLEKYQSNNPDAKYRLSYFGERNKVPNPNDSWLKRKKWFWCNKEDYLTWKTYRKNRLSNPRN